MSIPIQAEQRNRLLALMSPEDFALLAPVLQACAMPRTFVMVEADGLADHVYFPGSGVVSIIATSPAGLQVEVGLFGRDGFGPSPAILGSDRSPHQVIMQVGGEGCRLERGRVTDAMRRSETLNTLLLRFTQVMNVQAGFTALSNAVHAIDARLARWILMCHDRHVSDDIPLTHDFLAIMLAVRRPSVTSALHVLEGNRLIRLERGCVMVRNRIGLEDFARDAYGKPEAEYRRLIGPMN